jgi:hypothetical protein
MASSQLPYAPPGSAMPPPRARPQAAEADSPENGNPMLARATVTRSGPGGPVTKLVRRRARLRVGEEQRKRAPVHCPSPPERGGAHRRRRSRLNHTDNAVHGQCMDACLALLARFPSLFPRRRRALARRQQAAPRPDTQAWITTRAPLQNETKRQLADAPPPPSRHGKIPLEKGFSQVDWLRTARERAGEGGGA